MVPRLGPRADETPVEHPKRRLQPREATAAQLGGVSVATIRRLEQRGKLRAIRLGPARGQVFHEIADVDRLIAEASDDAS